MPSEKEIIEEFLEYVPSLGLFWKKNRPPAKKGQKVFGRAQLRICGKRIYNHHIVWFIHHGYFPSDKGIWIDHADGNPDNNTIENLRIVTPEQNNMNRGPRRNRELPKGVYERQGKYDSRIQWKGQVIFLGLFDTVSEAEAAYQGASRVLQREFSFYNRDGLSLEAVPVKIITEKEQQE
jgi:hypothetical protein